MTGDAPTTPLYRFGCYVLDLERGVLLCDGDEVPLRRQSFDVLVHLVRNPGRLVTREELLEDIWAGKVVTDASITQCLVEIRAAIDDIRHDKIRTLTARGYRFELPVEHEWTGTGRRTVGPDESDHAPAAAKRSPMPRVFMAVLVPAAVILAIAWQLLEPESGLDRGPDQTRDAATEAPVGDADGRAQPYVVAVLPFGSQSPAQEDTFLAEGLADEILSSLARRRTVSVIGGTSSFQFRGDSKKDLSELIEKLSVTHVVDGSVRRSESGLRISVHLIDTRTGHLAWSETYRRDDANIYTIPVATAAAILGALGTTSEASGPDLPSAPNPEAYRDYLAARALLRDPLLAQSANLRRAITMLEGAVARDPGLAEAWASLGLTRLNIVVVRPGRASSGFRNRDPEARLAAARMEAEQALALDPNAVDALLALAIIDYRARVIPLAEAENRFRAVLEISPENPDVNVRMGMMLLELGRIRDASEHFARAARLDPLNVTTYGFYLPSLVYTGRHEEAQRIIESGRTPWYATSFQRLENALVAGQVDEARAWLEFGREFPAYGPHGLTPSPSGDSATKNRLDGLFERLVAVEASGDTAADTRLARDFIAAADEGLILHSYVALFLGAAGFEDPVFDLVRNRLNVDDLYIRSVLFRPALAGLRADPRVMQWFDAGTQLDYWMATGRWPDFCADPDLPYNCREAGQRFIDSR
jgi:TolB-like protein/DNA-binding winged helix-turn-helix (wHTH) protein/Tfp pilus assembly protein PilF